VVFGGTPSIKGLSTIEEAFQGSDQRKFYVPCHECGESHVARPETAFYACPHCGAIWDDEQKNRNVRQATWVATAEFRGVAGFYLNELYSPFPGSRFTRLVERYLEAQHRLEQGDDTEMIVFVNSAKGLPYEYESAAPDIDDLEARALPYAELTVPAGGLLLSAGVDVQHDRLAVTKLVVTAVSIDASDGQTSDQVYTWVRERQRRGVMAVKGLSNDYGQREIYSAPKRIDYKTKTKAAKHGLQVYTVGTHKAKDLLIGDRGRISLTGNGPGRMHWYQDVRADFYEQLTSEIKAPHRSLRNKRVWQVRSGVRNEALDCTVYALHAARSVKVHLMTDAKWEALEARLMQTDLFSEPRTETSSADDAPASRQRPKWKP